MTGHAFPYAGHSGEKRHAKNLRINMVRQTIEIGMTSYAVENLRVTACRIKAVIHDRAANSSTQSLGRSSMTDIAAYIGRRACIIVVERIKLPDAIFMQTRQALWRMARNAANQHIGMSQSHVDGAGRQNMTAYT